MADASEVARQFGRNMQRLRKESGLSQEALAFRATLHRTEIGLLERGERCPRIDTLVKLAVTLGVRIECPLFDGISWTAGTKTIIPGSFSFAEADADSGGSG